MSAEVVHEWASSVRQFAQDWPARGARVAAAELERALAADTGGDGRLRNLSEGPATVTVDEGVSEASVTADGAAAVWAILENGTRDHVITARPGRYLLTPFGPRRMVQVSGVNARRTWTVGAAAGLVQAERDADAAFAEMV